jgi:sugar phosphate isomerase/epimerase
MLDDTPRLRETAAQFADTGVRLLDIEALRLLPDNRHDDARRILDAGARLGARNVLVIANDPDEGRLVERLAAVCAAAVDRGLRACLEFMIFSAVRTLADARGVLDRAGHRGGAVLVDALHLCRSGGTPADLAAVPARLLPYAQLCDAPAEPARPVVDEGWPYRRAHFRPPGTSSGLELSGIDAAVVHQGLRATPQ